MVETIEQNEGIHYLKILGRSKKKMINVAILGYGTVGSGVFEVLNENKESISRRAGQELHVKYVLIFVIFRDSR